MSHMRLKHLVISFFFFGEGVGRVKSTISSISSMADSSELLNRPPESLSLDISGMDGVTVGHLLGVRSSGGVGDLGMAGRLLGCPY